MSYEFSPAQNIQFAKLSLIMISLSIFRSFIGIVGIVNGILILDYFLVIVGVMTLIMAIVFFLPVNNFNNIINTEGNDIRELIQAFRELEKGFSFVLIPLLVIIITRLIELVIN